MSQNTDYVVHYFETTQLVENMNFVHQKQLRKIKIMCRKTSQVCQLRLCNNHALSTSTSILVSKIQAYKRSGKILVKVETYYLDKKAFTVS